MKRLAIFSSGYGSNFQAILDAVRRKKIPASVELFVCDNPKAFALRRAARYNIPVFCISPKLFEDRPSYERLLIRVLKSQKIDLIILAGFMRIFSPTFIRAFQGRILNVHPSLLPEFKGAHAIRDAFEVGVKETGVTIHMVTADVDAGPILAQEKVTVTPKDTLEILEAKIHRVEHRLYPETIRRYLQKFSSKH